MAQLSHQIDNRTLARHEWLGPTWEHDRFAQVGWFLLPLRLFLGITFTYAAVQKFSDPSFFGSTSPTSVQAQMRALAPSSPIGWLIDLSLHFGPLTGVLIAAGELCVGLAALLGLKLRWASCAGALLALTFFLTVSWNTRPYYYGADIVFLFAWTPFIALGAAGVLSIDGFARARSHRSGAGVPGERMMQRRAVVATAGLALMTAAASTVLGHRGDRSDSATGRHAGRRRSSRTSGQQSTPPHPSAPTQGAASTPPAAPPTSPAGMTEIAKVSDIGLGAGRPFHDPSSGNPAWLVRTESGAVAFSAVCTHAGCPVDYQQSAKEFVCPCHGGTYSATTGAVLGGPPPSPLPAIAVKVVDGRIYVR